MPRIPNEVLRCTFFLYRSAADAQNGVRAGGTGFVVSYGMPASLYAVTNYHLAVRNGCSCIRIMLDESRAEILDFDPADWEFLPGGPDLAALLLPTDRLLPARNPIDGPFVRSIGVDMFALNSDLQRDNIGAGEDVFMVGRFMDNDGGDRNLPSVRFGNISAMPTPILQPNKHLGECYTLDMHSRTGFSGSPVFAFRTFGQDLVDGGESRANVRSFGRAERLSFRPVFRLLGVHCAQFPERIPIRGDDDDAEPRYVEGLSGMTVCVPAWHVKELLDIPKFARPRIEAEREFRRSIGLPVPESSGPNPTAE